MNVHNSKRAVTDKFSIGEMLSDALGSAPQSVAFKFKSADLTRGDLAKQAAELASRLHDAGLRPGAAVAIEIEHSLELPIAMCGVQIAGACAVPVDPQASAERREAILADICPEFVLRRADTDVGILIEKREQVATSALGVDPDLAFIVYTSGSSGGPKGVMITSESYVRRMQHILPTFSPSADDVDLAWTPSSFTVMVDEIFLPILAGMPSVIAEPHLRTDPRGFADLIQKQGVTTFRLTPSMLDLMLRSGVAPSLSGVRTIICSGEAMPIDLQSRAHSLLSATLLGFYGATEAPAVAYIPYDREQPLSDASICIPQPFAQFKIMRDDATPAEMGEVGEVWVGGLAVAKGYFRRPKLTSEKFLDHLGERWYRTGDLGRGLPKGHIEILGRADSSEVNINGARVSLVEVLETLREHSVVDAAWISAVDENGMHSPTLVAQIVVGNGSTLNAPAIRQWLATRLPSPSVPSVLLGIPELPLTDNGKTDARGLHQDAAIHLTQLRNAVATIERHDADVGAGNASSNHILRTILETAERLLEMNGLKHDDNFYAVGGSSLMAVDFSLKLSDALEQTVETALISNTASFDELARSIEFKTEPARFGAQMLRDGDPDISPLITINDRRRYEILTPQLSTDCQVWNLDAFGLSGEALSDLATYTLEEIADVFANEIVAKHPDGPWTLVAFCQSACLAAETARVLQKRSRKTCSIFLIDSFFDAFLPTPRIHFKRLIDFGPSYYLRKLGHRLGLSDWSSDGGDIPFEVHSAVLNLTGDEKTRRQRFIELCRSYKVIPVDSPITMFVSKEFRHNSRLGAKQLAGQGLKVEVVEGLHMTLFQPKPNERGLAEAIDAEL